MKDQAIALIEHLPPTIRALRIHYAKFRKQFMDAIINHVKNSSKLTFLNLYNTKVDDNDDGQDACV